jgi:predicted RNase H-like HicB family nuclease
MPKYIGVLHGAPGAYTIFFPDLPDCVAIGDTEEEAKTRASEALRAWLDDIADDDPVQPIASTAKALRKVPQVSQALAGGALLVVIEVA